MLDKEGTHAPIIIVTDVTILGACLNFLEAPLSYHNFQICCVFAEYDLFKTLNHITNTLKQFYTSFLRRGLKIILDLKFTNGI